MPKSAIIFVAGLMLGVVAGYALHRVLPPPFGSAPVETRQLTNDMDLNAVYFFSARPPISGVIRKGSRIEVEWRKSQARYIALRTVVSQDTLARLSKPVSQHGAPPN